MSIKRHLLINASRSSYELIFAAYEKDTKLQ